MKPILTIGALCREAEKFARSESFHWETSLYGVTDGKAVGTYFEHKFQRYLHEEYGYDEENISVNLRILTQQFGRLKGMKAPDALWMSGYSNPSIGQ